MNVKKEERGVLRKRGMERGEREGERQKKGARREGNEGRKKRLEWLS